MTPRASGFVLILVTFLCAFNGFLTETNITISIAAALGGTIFQYQLGTGLFIFSLGVGSLLYPKLTKRFGDRKLLLFSSFGLAVLSVVGPLVPYWISESLHLTLSNPFAWLVYSPLIMVGLITGADLPILIFFSEKLKLYSERTILSLDYLGMFCACLIFPFLFQKWGVFNIIPICTLISIVTFFIAFSLPQVQHHPPKNSDQKSPHFILWLSFLLSFCSLSYELLLARWLVDFFTNEVFAMTFAIGFYLLGLSVGALLQTTKKWGASLLKIELLLITSVLFIPIVGYGFATIWISYLKTPESLLITQSLLLLGVGWVGFLSGHELPLLMRASSDNPAGDWPRLLFWNYFGALIASLSVSLFVLPSLGLYSSFLSIVAINFIALFIIILKTKGYNIKTLGFIGAVTVVITLAPHIHRTFEQVFLKATYNKVTLARLSVEAYSSFKVLHRELSDIKRIVTPYQNIDLVRSEIPSTGAGLDDLTLYLNRQPQFSLFDHSLYHDSFCWGAINLSGSVPKKVLILGGGDGLLASLISEIDGVEDITLIELDQAMVKLAQNHYRLRKANKDIFNTKKVNIIIGDAFSWLKKNTKKYDGVFIDFPYPYSYELSRLYSVEFYSRVSQALSDDGFIILNAPISFNINSPNAKHFLGTRTLIHTLNHGGFLTTLPFGSKEPFIYAEKRQREIAFNYRQFPGELANSSFVNFVPIKEVLELESGTLVNSVYKPEKVLSW